MVFQGVQYLQSTWQIIMVKIPLCSIKVFPFPLNEIANCSHLHAGQAALMKSVLKPGYNFDQLLVLGTFMIFSIFLVFVSQYPHPRI